MKCCATDRAISCSTIWAAAKTMRRRAFAPTAPTSSTSCAPILPSRWGYRSATPNCSRGTGGKPPKCYQWFDIEHPEVTRPPPPPEQEVASADRHATPPGKRRRLLRFVWPLAAGRATGSSARKCIAAEAEAADESSANICATSATSSIPAARVAAGDDNTDFYTVPLTQQALRPGTVYADPYGHVLMLVRRVPEANGTPGVFLAVDAEPDGSITRKRFWRGNFLFAHEPYARHPRLQAFPPDHARQERSVAAAEQRRDRQKSAIRRFFARAVANDAPRISTIAWMT